MLLWISIDKHTRTPMLRQVYEAFRVRILSGDLPAGFKLPSTRELAVRLNVSRNVILEAYELLLAEGFIEGRSGSGTYVAEGALFPNFSMQVGNLHTSVSEGTVQTETPMISFRTGLPALDLFPRKQWASVLQTVCREVSDRTLSYGDPSGDPEFRNVMADYLARTRGVIAKPDQIVITTGAVQAIQLIARLLLSSGDEALVEEPTNNELKSILSSTGAVLRPIPVDDSGISTSLLPRNSSPKCVYVTPSHQFPLGGILPIQRRIELIRYAVHTGCYIIEDDYDSEFRFDGGPIHSLQSIDPDRVTYIGSFSKILFPSLRIGYIVLPPLLVDAFIHLKRLSDFQTPTLEQLALTRYIEKRFLHSHVLKMKKVYRERRQILVDSLEAHFAGRFRICGRSAGLHLVAEFDFPLPENLPERLLRENVFTTPLAENRILVGYGHLSEEQIREGVNRIRRVICDSD
jgi:GntR family transcriptional regulator/MocR family aminotransferase